MQSGCYLSESVDRVLGAQHAYATPLYAARCFSQTTAVQESKEVPGIYVANIEGRQNSSPILLGLADYFERHMSSVGFFQPVSLLSPSDNVLLTALCKRTYMQHPAGVWRALSQLNNWTVSSHRPVSLNSCCFAAKPQHLLGSTLGAPCHLLLHFCLHALPPKFNTII